MTPDVRRIVIVGAGQAGARAALTLRANGFDGAISLLGAEPELPYERPPLSKALLAGEVDDAACAIGGITDWAGRDILWCSGERAVAIDRAERTVTTDLGSHQYDRLLIATGSTPRMLPGAAVSPRIVTLRTMADARDLRSQLGMAASILIIGGGLIGLEVAATARKLGVAVTVIEAGAGLLNRVLPPDLAATVHARHVGMGSTIVTGAIVSQLVDDGAGVTCRLDDRREIQADLCLVAIGSEPDVALARSAGLPVMRGVLVDRHLRSEDPTIYAAGDCAEIVAADRHFRFEDYASAEAQARVAASNMLGGESDCSLHGSFWSDQGDIAIRGTGLAGAVAYVDRRYPDANVLFALDAEGGLAGAFCVGGGPAAQDVRLAQLLMEQDAPIVDRGALADPGQKLKRWLRH